MATKTPKMGRYLTKILKEMCRRVGDDFRTIDFKNNDWYLKNCWTEKQEDSFIKWMVDYLYNTPAARDELGVIAEKRFGIEKSVMWFMLSFGWKYKDSTVNNHK